MLTKNKLKNIRAYANAKCVIESIADAQKWISQRLLL